MSSTKQCGNCVYFQQNQTNALYGNCCYPNRANSAPLVELAKPIVLEYESCAMFKCETANFTILTDVPWLDD